MLLWDRHAEAWIVAHRVGALDPVFRWLSYAGTEGAVWLAIAAVLAVVERRRRPLVLVAVADLAAQILSSALQSLVGRARPHVHTLVSEPHSHSFPSGHATSSVACALVLCALAPRWLRAGLVVLALAIAYSRLYVGVHYPLDVLAGAALGAGLAWATLSLAARLSGSRGLPRPGAGRRRARRVPPAG